MKILALSTAACATVAFASPAGHMNLAKRAAFTTQTLVKDGKTMVEVIDSVEATVFGTTTVTQTATETATDYSYVFEYTGAADNEDVIARLREILAGVFGDGGENTATSGPSDASSATSTDASTSDDTSSASSTVDVSSASSTDDSSASTTDAISAESSTDIASSATTTP